MSFVPTMAGTGFNASIGCRANNIERAATNIVLGSQEMAIYLLLSANCSKDNYCYT
jgi:hypothetical protein